MKAETSPAPHARGSEDRISGSGRESATGPAILGFGLNGDSIDCPRQRGSDSSPGFGRQIGAIRIRLARGFGIFAGVPHTDNSNSGPSIPPSRIHPMSQAAVSELDPTGVLRAAINMAISGWSPGAAHRATRRVWHPAMAREIASRLGWMRREWGLGHRPHWQSVRHLARRECPDLRVGRPAAPREAS
jgi:hypothetical protein